MFSAELIQYAGERFAQRFPYFGTLQKEIEEKLSGCTEEEKLLMEFLYGTMPIQDVGMYDFSLFLSFVRHALMLRRQVEWCRRLPEGIFLQYVLYPRINTEGLEDCRPFFYGQLIERIQGLSMTEAALEINYWCAEIGTYQSTDDRTASPAAFYRAGKGRCGEESTFAVTAFRSVGIPARQVYTPRWAHCDDNHAWIEVWTGDGEGEGWHFLGACEPEEILDKGWFTNASSRAMLVHTMTFSDFPVGDEVSVGDAEEQTSGTEALLESAEFSGSAGVPGAEAVLENAEIPGSAEILGGEGPVFYYNDTDIYARVKRLRIWVEDSQGRPEEGVSVSANILNMAEFYPVAQIKTNKAGEAFLTMGLGDIFISAEKGGRSCQALVSVKNTDGCVLQLPDSGAKLPAFDRLTFDRWEDFQVEAPEDYPLHPARLTREQKEKNRERMKEAAALRQKRMQDAYQEEKAAAYPGEQDILREAGGNFTEIYQFLSRDENPWRAKLLRTLTAKDYRDVRAETLEDHLLSTMAFAPEGFAPEIFAEEFLRDEVGTKENSENETDKKESLQDETARNESSRNEQEEIFTRYILCPRIRYEELTNFRSFIEEWFSPAEKAAFRSCPDSIWEYIQSTLSWEPELDYGSLFASPAAALRLGRANETSRKILFVSICRTLGIPARLNPVNLDCEIYENGDFRRVCGKMGEKEADERHGFNATDSTVSPAENPTASSPASPALITLIAEDASQWKYFQTWTIGRWQENRFISLDYSDAAFKDGKLSLTLAPGRYQILTTRRLPNGNQLASRYCFFAEAADRKAIPLRLRQADANDLLMDHSVEDFTVTILNRRNGKEEAASISQILKGSVNLLAFLAEGQEPTEHVLNELLEERDALRRQEPQIIFLLSDKEALENATLKKVLEAMPEIQTAVADFDELAEPLARRLYVDPDKLPLLAAMGADSHAFYACSGYNVGSVALITKLMGVKREKDSGRR